MSFRKFIYSCFSLMLALTCFQIAMAGENTYAESDQVHWLKKLKQHFQEKRAHIRPNVQLGPRPFYLIHDMDDSQLKDALTQCQSGPFYKTEFSIGHRGAPLQFPEHTKESYEAAAKMGAGIIECDVTFTKDKELVCRHSQCDLHTTTNVLATELGEKCSEPFTPFDGVNPASAKCCTSDFTLAEFKSLCGKMDAANTQATNVDDYLNGTSTYRTDLYSSCGTLMTHKESIALFKSLKVKMTPELKSPSVSMPFDGDYSQQDYAQQLIDEYKEAGVPARKVYAQSFNLDDVLYWIEHEPRFGKRAVYLDDRVYQQTNFTPSLADFEQLAARGVRIVAPPMWALLDINERGELIPSDYAVLAKEAGLELITWTLERSGLLKDGGGWYYQSVSEAINNDGGMLEALHVLAQDVGVKGVFSDWPATTTFYGNCMGL